MERDGEKVLFAIF